MHWYARKKGLFVVLENFNARIYHLAGVENVERFNGVCSRLLDFMTHRVTHKGMLQGLSYMQRISMDLLSTNHRTFRETIYLKK